MADLTAFWSLSKRWRFKRIFSDAMSALRNFATQIVSKFICTAPIFLLGIAILGAANENQKPQNSKKNNTRENKSLSDSSIDKILANYSFVADFNQKEPEREISEEIFWRYQYLLPKIDFPIEVDFSDPTTEMPVTKGSGRPIDHLNRGRMFFLENKYTEAKSAWLSGRARYGKEYPQHRRSDYFVGYVFLQLARQLMQDTGKSYDDPMVKSNFSNAATFLEWAFVLKADQGDPLLDLAAPKGLYNLAAVKWRYGRFAGAYGAAEAGLNFLRKVGRKDYRSQFHRIIAESFIQNRSYLEAVQTLDQAIRQDQQHSESAAGFARVGDIYFDLNNYELAEDAYALGAKIDEDLRQINPAQLVLRGESLFWLGRFSEAQSALHMALEGIKYRKETAPLPSDFRPWASLRIADAYLARAAVARIATVKSGFKLIEREDRDNFCEELNNPKSKDIPARSKLYLSQYCTLIDKAKLEYFRVSHDYQNSLAGQIAKLRSSCLELPYYGGQNVRHTREFLEQSRAMELPPVAIELGWACQVGSYTQRERTPEMIERVKKFFEVYPNSRFLASFVQPVREFQARKIDELFDAGDKFGALSFFETNRKSLFSTIDDELAAKLFVTYTDAFMPEKAKEFWAAYEKVEPNTDINLLREAVVAAELADKKDAKEWRTKNEKMAKFLISKNWNLPPNPAALSYVRRLLNVSTLDIHLDWLANLAKSWSQKDSDYACDLEVPLLSRLIADSSKSRRDRAFARLTTMIDAKLPALFKVDGSCALSMLEIEQKFLRQRHPIDSSSEVEGENRLPALAARYLARQDWPLISDFLHMYWTVSEHIHSDGDLRSAKLLWQVLRDKGPPDAMETQFAKARLDPTRTETEKLWD